MRVWWSFWFDARNLAEEHPPGNGWISALTVGFLGLSLWATWQDVNCWVMIVLASAIAYYTLYCWRYGLIRLWLRYQKFRQFSEAQYCQFIGESLTAILKGERYEWFKDYCHQNQIPTNSLPVAMEFVDLNLLHKHLPDYSRLLQELYLLYGPAPNLEQQLNFAYLERTFPQIFDRCSQFLEDTHTRRQLQDFPFYYLIKYGKMYEETI